MSRNIAIITARGGSKRIPRKNIRPFLGKPIIAYSIAAAIEAGCFAEVMVSTDDQQIAEIALRYGATIPFLRSADTANDFATTADVLVEVLNEYDQKGEVFEYGCCIYPTAPFVTAGKLRSGFDLILKTGADTVIPVVRFDCPIQRALKIENNRLSMMWPEHVNTRSQDLVPSYHDSGQFYFFQIQSFMETHQLFGDNTVPIEMPATEVQDIDTVEDWHIAEMKYRLMLQTTMNESS